MTNSSAILLLKDQIKMFENGKERTAEKALVYMEQHIEALNMAIYALEQIAPVKKRERRCGMTNKEYLSNLSNENWYRLVDWLFHEYSMGFTDSRIAIIKWLDSEYKGGSEK